MGPPYGPGQPLGQMPFFIDYLKQGGLFDAWTADCPLGLRSPNAPSKRDLLGTLLLSTLAGHYRYAHVTSLRCDAVNPPLLGMNKLVSEDSLRRNLARIDEAARLNWLQDHLDYCTAPLLSEPWVLDIDTTAKPLCGHQEGAAVGYNHKLGRPSATTAANIVLPQLPYGTRWSKRACRSVYTGGEMCGAEVASESQIALRHGVMPEQPLGSGGSMWGEG